MSLNNLIITLVSMNQGLYKLKIKPVTGETYYKDVEAEKLYDFLMYMDYYCDVKGYTFHWIIPETIRHMVKKHYKMQ